MKLFTTMLVALAGLSAGAMASSGAMAADMIPVKATPPSTTYSKSWSGFYLGAYVGYGINTTAAIVDQGPLSINLGDAPRGFLGGGVVGADWQVNQNFVLGVFANTAIANLKAHGAMTVGGVQTLGIDNASNYIGAIGGRAGFLVSDNNLLYGKGGFAFGGAKPDFTAIGTTKAISDTSTGWVAGAGMEHRFSPNVSVFLEGTYTRLGDKTLTLAPLMTSTAKYHIVEQKIGMQYRF